jgi:uncharacterized protein YdcH (DUF465 family)
MEIKKEVLDTILNSDINFKRLYSAHSKLKIKIKDLNKTKFPTTEEVAQKKQHQKQKLILKDKMEVILSKP